MVDPEWDDNKEAANVVKHHIDFRTAVLIWEGPTYEQPDSRGDYGESRFVAFGVAENRVLAVVYTPRGEARRIISARRASAREKRLYEAEIARRNRPPPPD